MDVQEATSELPQKVSDPEVPARNSVNGAIIWGALIVAVALVGVAALVVWAIGRDDDTSRPTGYQEVDVNRYQAVFLSNGQVYFGKLSDSGTELAKLTNVWYLQVQQGTAQSAELLKDDNKSQISLAKMGNELHGPDDSMSIAKDQILFWENLNNSGKVVKAINEAK